MIFIYYSLNQYQYFIVNENNDFFYNVPQEITGKKIPNKNVKILDYNYNLSKETKKNYSDIEFSIQLNASSNFENILKTYKNYISNKEDLFIVSLKHNLGIEYLLTYKNFINRKMAFDYCINYLDFIENCLIVNVNNLD